MTVEKIIAVPSHKPGGEDGEVSEHFGHSDTYTLAVIEDQQIKKVSVIPGIPHEQGGCMITVNYLAENGVNAMVAQNMGQGPFQGFQSVGIELFHSNGLTRVGDILEQYCKGELPGFVARNTCRNKQH